MVRRDELGREPDPLRIVGWFSVGADLRPLREPGSAPIRCCRGIDVQTKSLTVCVLARAGQLSGRVLSA